MLDVRVALRELGESKMSLIMKDVRVVVVAGGGGVLLAAFQVGTVGEELDAAPLEETELRSVGKLLLMVQRAAVSGFTLPTPNAPAGFASVK